MMPPFNQLPDQPESFGYKVSWFALRTSDPASVLDALQFGDAGQLVVRPCRRNGLSPEDAVDELFKAAEVRGEEEAEEQKWLAASGLSAEEAYKKVIQNAPRTFPAEDDVVNLAGLWSIDPSQLSDQDHPAGLGLAARLPDDLRQ